MGAEGHAESAGGAVVEIACDALVASSGGVALVAVGEAVGAVVAGGVEEVAVNAAGTVGLGAAGETVGQEINAELAGGCVYLQ